MLKSRALTLQFQDGVRTVMVPDDPESNMQTYWDRHGQNDAFFPFWLEVWPSAMGLYTFLRQHSINLQNALEIGCGNGVLAQLLQGYGGHVLHTDLVPDACAFARSHISDSKKHPIVAMDMSKPSLAFVPDCILGTDLFYEDRLVEMVLKFLSQTLPTNGCAYIADPNRSTREVAIAKIMAESSLPKQQHRWDFDLNGEKQRIDIWMFRAIP